MKFLNAINKTLFLTTLFIAYFLSGCQPKVYLMPSPVGIRDDNIFFQLSPSNKDENRLNTLYATNRLPTNFSSENDSYTIFPSNDLRLGLVTHQVGNEGDTWDDFYNKSLSKDRAEDILITLKHTRELLSVDEEQSVDTFLPENSLFFEHINKIINESADKDITVYVHGANSNFYRATAQGAQYFHYTGHNSVVLTFSWPSAENILKYKVDVLHAGKTVPAFARLLAYLAVHTSAKNINIIAYSAGAQVVAPALVHIRNSMSHLEPSTIKKQYRIGEVYFAAPDIDAQSFAYRFSRFKDIVERITISSNMSDSVLLHAQRFTGKSRLGRPVADELTTQEIELLIRSSLTKSLDILDIDGSRPLNVGKSHSFWYSHPWVSNDLLLLMLLKLSPEDRRLTRVIHKSGMEIWQFPESYEMEINSLLERIRKPRRQTDRY